MIWLQLLIVQHESELQPGQIEDIGVFLRLRLHNRWGKKKSKFLKMEKESRKTNAKLANC